MEFKISSKAGTELHILLDFSDSLVKDRSFIIYFYEQRQLNNLQIPRYSFFPFLIRITNPALQMWASSALLSQMKQKGSRFAPQPELELHVMIFFFLTKGISLFFLLGSTLFAEMTPGERKMGSGEERLEPREGERLGGVRSPSGVGCSCVSYLLLPVPWSSPTPAVPPPAMPAKSAGAFRSRWGHSTTMHTLRSPGTIHRDPFPSVADANHTVHSIPSFFRIYVFRSFRVGSYG